jgi:hypothetical protein
MDAFERHVALTVERQLGDEGHTRKPDGTSTRHTSSASHPLPCQLPVPASPFPSLSFVLVGKYDRSALERARAGVMERLEARAELLGVAQGDQLPTPDMQRYGPH